MLNSVVLIGRLTRDPELRYTGQGTAVGGFSLAVDRPFTNQQGERETDFIDVVVWRQLAEQVANHLTKGRLVAVQGRLQMRSYETQDGQRRKVAEVVANDVKFLDKPKNNAQGEEPAGVAGAAPGGGGGGFGADDDVPF